MSPELLQMWRGFIDGGHTDDWRQAAMIAATIENGFRRIANALGDNLEMVEETDMIPRFASCELPSKLRRLVSQGMDDAKIGATLTAAFGRPPSNG